MSSPRPKKHLITVAGKKRVIIVQQRGKWMVDGGTSSQCNEEILIVREGTE